MIHRFVLAGSRGSDIYRKEELRGLNLSSCSKGYGSVNISLNSNQLCAGSVAGRDGCIGDHGK